MSLNVVRREIPFPDLIDGGLALGMVEDAHEISDADVAAQDNEGWDYERKERIDVDDDPVSRGKMW